MSKHIKTSRNHKAIRTVVLMALRGMVVFLLFTHQALANIICCGAVQFESQAFCHLNAVEMTITAEAPNPNENAESSHCHVAEVNKTAPPKVNERITQFAQPVNEFSWCCQASPAAEPQPLIPMFGEQVTLSIAPVFLALAASDFSASGNALSPPPKSRPIFLTVSCLLI